MFRQVASYMDDTIERRLDRRGFRLEAIVVFVCGAVGAIGFGYVGMEALDALESDNTMLQYHFIAETIRPILLVFGLWVWYAIGSHLLASHYNGRGPISRLFRTSAWALVPIGIWNLLRSGAVVALFWNADFPEDTTGLGLGPDAHVQSILELGLDSPAYVGVLLLGVVFTVWSGFLLANAIERSKNVPEDDARKIAAVVSGVFALYLLWSALGWAGIA